MTLAESIPTLRASLPPSLHRDVWPAGTHWASHGDLTVAGVGLTGLAAAHGTPAYVVDEADVRLRCRQYLAAFGAGRVAYTAKALLSVGVARWIAEEGLDLYVGSAGELHVAQAAGFPMDRIVLYGSAKTPDDLHAAYTAGVGTIVVESLSEITRLAATAPPGQRVLLRVLAGPEPPAASTTGSGQGSAPARPRRRSRGSPASRGCAWPGSTAPSATRSAGSACTNGRYAASSSSAPRCTPATAST